MADRPLKVYGERVAGSFRISIAICNLILSSSRRRSVPNHVTPSTGTASSSSSSPWWRASLPWPWSCRTTSCGWPSTWSSRCAAVAGLFFLAGADFLGAMQLMVYVGGTLVLLVFGVMLTARGPFVSMAHRRRAVDPGPAGRRGAAWPCCCRPCPRVEPMGKPSRPASRPPKRIPRQRSWARPGRRAHRPGRYIIEMRWAITPPIGYLLPFEIISLHLLVVLVGAAFLARAKHVWGPGSRELN